jgi:hypothetical protein
MSHYSAVNDFLREIGVLFQLKEMMSSGLLDAKFVSELGSLQLCILFRKDGSHHSRVQVLRQRSFKSVLHLDCVRLVLDLIQSEEITPSCCN